MSFHYILCIDFDGVLHMYTSPWAGATSILDGPVEGAIDWLTNLVKDGRFVVNIYSSRSKELEGVLAMQRWLYAHGLDKSILEKIKFPTQKPAAFLTIDDRAICFMGFFPTHEMIVDFKPWNKM